MDIEVTPKNWLLPNRIGYNKKIFNDFHPNNYSKTPKKKLCKCDADVCDVDTNVITLFPHQRLIKDYIQFDSPYRGILLYHELGSGKSAASLAAAEGYIERKKIVVLTPASLAQNYENEIMKISKLGSNLKKIWSFVVVKDKNADVIKVLDKYAISPTFIKKDGGIWIPLYQNDIPDATVLKNNQDYKTLSAEDRTKIDITITHIIRNRYKFISYNGLTTKNISELGKEPFNNSFVVVDEIHNFISRVVNGSKLARSVYNSLMSAVDCKLVLLSGTPIINNPYEIATLINLLRGPMDIYEINLLKKSIDPSINDIETNLIQTGLMEYIDEFNYDKENRILHISLLPKGYKKENVNSVNIIKYQWKATIDKTIENIVSSLNTIKGVKFSINPSKKSYYALPNQKEEFDKIFLDDSDPEKPKVRNNDLFVRRILGTVSYYKTTGTEYFPKLLPTSIEYLNMTDHQLDIYSGVRNDERKLDNANKKRKAQGGLFAKQSSVYRAYSRMVCNFVFPTEIPRQFPKDIRNVVNVEMDVKDADKSGESIESVNEEELAELKKKKDKKIAGKYEEELTKALRELEVNKDILTSENLKKKYSPKFSRMLENIEESPGSVLMYSQFRRVEGLGIFSLVLKSCGYKEIEVKKQDGEYVFDDLSVFDEKYDNKRFVVFNEDRIKTNILMNLFNGAYSLLPKSIQNQLPDDLDQLHGKVVKLMMITQSGAEGISLKNVRRVLITEPFWNNVRISQVIGRAVRTCSHEQLPVDERNVQVFMYIMKFTKEQMDKDFTLRTLDKELTTDQHIMDIAKRKENIIDTFLNMMKSAAMDCINNSLQNKPLSGEYRCYHWPINVNNNELAFTKDINNDNKIMQFRKLQMAKKDKGRVISKDGKKYVLLNDKIYEYYSYINAGVLLPVDPEEFGYENKNKQQSPQNKSPILEQSPQQQLQLQQSPQSSKKSLHNSLANSLKKLKEKHNPKFNYISLDKKITIPKYDKLRKETVEWINKHPNYIIQPDNKEYKGDVTSLVEILASVWDGKQPTKNDLDKISKDDYLNKRLKEYVEKMSKDKEYAEAPNYYPIIENYGIILRLYEIDPDIRNKEKVKISEYIPWKYDTPQKIQEAYDKRNVLEIALLGIHYYSVEDNGIRTNFKSSEKDVKTLNNFLKKEEYNKHLYYVEGDGNCFFHAIIRQLKLFNDRLTK
jgi:hypothetical protein